jgi:hypothetical protein
MRTVAAVALVMLAAGAAGCIRSKCYSNLDCAADEICLENGSCAVPECKVDEQCAAGYYCHDFACEKGCVKDADCGQGRKCMDRRCVLYGQSCQCVMAEPFCLLDVNPYSATGGGALCLPEEGDAAVALFFGSIGCSHCRNIFAALEEIEKEVAAAGKTPRLVWMQASGYVIPEGKIEQFLGTPDYPILQDTAEAKVWEKYAAAYYDIVLVDSYGCLTAHVTGIKGPEDLQGAGGEMVKGLWLDALSAECHAVVEEGGEPAAEAVEEVVPRDGGGEVVEPVSDAGDGAETVQVEAVEELALSDSEGVADGSEQADGCCQVEAVETGPTDAKEALVPEAVEAWESVAEAVDGGADWVEPFQLADVCQVVPNSGVELGQAVPHFLCKDVNSASAGFGTGVSDITLKGKVWIAYLGSCT